MPREARQPRNSPPSDPVAPDILGQHGGVTFQRERLAPIVRELMPLLQADWEENGVDRAKVPLNFDYNRYLDYDLTAILQIVTARDEGVLVGYVMAFVHPHIDHAGMGWAILTWYWLFPEYRHGGIGRGMLEGMLGFLREARVSVVEASEKVAAKHGLFERLGFSPVDTIYRKLLED